MTAKMKDGIVKRGSTWSYVMRVPDPATGKTKPKWFGGHATQRDAKAARDQARSRLAEGNYVETSKLTVAEYLADRWLPAVEATGKRSTTLRSYRMHIEQHIVPRIGGVRLQAISGDLLNRFYGELLREGRHDDKGGLSPATVRHVHAVMSKALGDAVRWNLILRNAALSADPPKAKGAGEHHHDTWSAKELATFLAATSEDYFAPLWHLLSSTGMRRGESLGLTWDDLDLDAGRARIRQTVVAIGYRIEMSQPKTARGRRSIALDTATVAALKTWKAKQAKERLALGIGRSEFVFTREDGAQLHPDRVTKMFNTLVKAAEVKRIRLHDLRHTHATLGLAAGINPKLMSERLGHATTSFTLDTYTASIPEMDHDVAETIARLVSGE